MAKPGLTAGPLLCGGQQKARLAAGLSINAEGEDYFAGAVFM
jgi:hypothetical protein